MRDKAFSQYLQWLERNGPFQVRARLGQRGAAPELLAAGAAPLRGPAEARSTPTINLLREPQPPPPQVIVDGCNVSKHRGNIEAAAAAAAAAEAGAPPPAGAAAGPDGNLEHLWRMKDALERDLPGKRVLLIIHRCLWGAVGAVGALPGTRARPAPRRSACRAPADPAPPPPARLPARPPGRRSSARSRPRRPTPPRGRSACSSSGACLSSPRAPTTTGTSFTPPWSRGWGFLWWGWRAGSPRPTMGACARAAAALPWTCLGAAQAIAPLSTPAHATPAAPRRARHPDDTRATACW
jgi:hypothetical protein